MNGAADPIRIVAAVLCDNEGRVLLVRKRGSSVFIQPGGKRESGEHARTTLARELAEELGVVLDPSWTRTLGTFEDDAVNEAGRRVRADAYAVRVHGEPQPRAEIEEIAWLAPLPPFPVPVAPLSARAILPAWRAFAADPEAALRRAPTPATAATASPMARLPPLPLAPLPPLPALPPLALQ